MSRSSISLWVVLGLLAAGSVFATDPEDSSATAPPAEDEQVVAEDSEEPQASFFATTTVTAVGREVDAFQVTTPVTVIPQAEVERAMADNAADLLRDQPGVDVNGVGPNQARPVIRGLRGLRVLFLEDGLRLNNARRQTDFGEVSGLVDVDDVAQAEVVRGPASVLYGSDAVGGVLNLITRVPSFTDGRHLTGGVGLRYGSAGDEQRAHASISGLIGERFRVSISGSTRSIEDYESGSGTFGEIRLDDGAVVEDTAVDDDTIFALASYDLDEGNRLTLRHRLYRADQTGFGFVDPDLIGDTSAARVRILYPFQDFDRTTLEWAGSSISGLLADTMQVQAYYQNNERALVNDIFIDIGPIGPGFPNSNVSALTNNETDLETFGGRLEAFKLIADKVLLTYGGEGYRDDSSNTDVSRTTTTLRFPFPPFRVMQVSESTRPNAPNATNTSYGGFVQGEIPFGNRLKATAGLRYQNVATRAEATPGWDTTGLDFDDDNVVGSANLLFQATDNLNAFVAYGTAFRAPNIIERLFNGPTPEGAGFQILNPSLTSEDSENIDVGLKYRRQDAYLEAVYFKNEVSDGIFQAFLSPAEIGTLPAATQAAIRASGARFVVQQRNIDRLRYEGVEAAIGYRFGFGLAVGGNYTHLSGRRVGLSAAPVDEQYTDKINLFARYEPTSQRFWVEYRLRHNGSADVQLDANEPAPPVGRELPAFSIHSLSGGYRIYDGARFRHSLGLRLENLTDELYAEFSNATFFRPETGRNVVATYRLGF